MVLTVKFGSRLDNGREVINTEMHRSLMDAKLRAVTLHWQILSIEPAPHPIYAPVTFLSHSLLD